MGRAWFEYKGVNSLDMYLYIENDISFPSPEADVEFIEVLGRDGEVATDNNRLKGVNFSIPVRLKLPPSTSVNYQATKISEWLKGNVGWFPLKFSGSEEYEYIAICYEQFDVRETLRNYGRTVINFRLKPYKRKVDTRPFQISNGQSLVNPNSRTAKPLIHIEGMGDVSFKNNGQDWLILEGVDREITVDSELGSVYRGNHPQYNKMIDIEPMFPLLYEGNNEITWTGNLTKVIIDPRWEAIT